MTIAATRIAAQYSHPCGDRKMKYPLWRWATMIATTMRAMSAAAATGVASPRISATPEPSSVSDASFACNLGARIPTPANHFAVLVIPPVRKILL